MEHCDKGMVYNANEQYCKAIWHLVQTCTLVSLVISGNLVQAGKAPYPHTVITTAHQTTQWFLFLHQQNAQDSNNPTHPAQNHRKKKNTKTTPFKNHGFSKKNENKHSPASLPKKHRGKKKTHPKTTNAKCRPEEKNKKRAPTKSTTLQAVDNGTWINSSLTALQQVSLRSGDVLDGCPYYK